MNSEPTQTVTKAPQRGAFSVGTQLIAFFAGIAGGLAFIQLYNGGMLGVLLAYLSPIPLFLVGLTCGRAAAITATLFALLAVYLRTSVETVLFFASVIAVPVMMLTRVSLIKFENGRFISGGTVLLAAMTLGTILMAAVAAILHFSGTGIADATQSILNDYKNMMLENNTANIPVDQIDQSLAMIKTALPALLLTSWFMIITVTGVLSQWFASEIKQNIRPTPFIKTITLPMWMVGIFVLCFIGSFIAAPDAKMVFTALATLYAIGFVIVGGGATHRWIDTKAVVHNWSDGKRLAIYILIYASIVILQLPIFFLLVFGLIAPFTEWRHSLTNGHSGSAKN